MKKNLDRHTISQKFQMLIKLDEQQRKKLQKQKMNKSSTKQGSFVLNINTKQKQKASKFPSHLIQPTSTSSQQSNKQLIYTKGDIVKQISKLKPYLAQQKLQLTTFQLQNLQNKKVSSQDKSKLSNVIIYLNKRLCEKLRQQAQLQKQFSSDRIKKQKQGWIYQVFYRYTDNIKVQLASTQFKNAYVVLTTIFQMYENLTFTNKLIKFNVSQIKRVKYIEEKQYQIIDIRFQNGILQLGFLNDVKLELFDRMLFLMKNMARTSTTRLFQNQLIKNLYGEY